MEELVEKLQTRIMRLTDEKRTLVGQNADLTLENVRLRQQVLDLQADNQTLEAMLWDGEK